LQGSEAGTAEFRQKLRDALEQSRDVAGSHGVYSLSTDDHFGHDQRARALITIKDGQWQLLEAPQ
jgi:branched-chain amino acid transport system substrate-binding protein